VSKGEELRQRRVVANLRQADVAREAGMSQSRLSNYEKNIHTPSKASRERVLKAIEGLRVPAVFDILWNTDAPGGRKWIKRHYPSL
jgi:transcriptional regulator with XRE-family HTH domain